MRHNLLVVVAGAVVLCEVAAVADPVLQEGGNTVADIRRLQERLGGASGTVKADVLDAIARATWQVLVRVPHKGIRETEDEIRAIIALRKGLEQRAGLPENLLAMRLQQAVDAALLHEIIQEHDHRGSESYYRTQSADEQDYARVHFAPDSFSPEAVKVLLDANRLDETERIRWSLGLENRLAQGFKKAGASVSAIIKADFSYRKMNQDDLERRYRHLAFSMLPIERTTEGLSEYAFACTLRSVDYARFARITAEVFFLRGTLPPTRKGLEAAITESISRLPPNRQREVLTAKTFDVGDVMNSVLKQAGKPGQFFLPLTAFLHPFLRDLSQCPGFPSERDENAVRNLFEVGWCLEFAPK